MTPEQQVPLRETCQKLKDAGIEFDSYFGWYAMYYSNKKAPKWKVGEFEAYNRIPSPTVPELLEKMPKKIKIEGVTVWLEIWSQKEGWKPVYIELDSGNVKIWISKHQNLAQALAETILWLHKEGYLK